MIQNWKHQDEAIDFILQHSATLVWGGMGVGKTRIGIGTISRLEPHRTLIVCPKAVMAVWREQFAIHWPKTQVPPTLKVIDKGDSKTKARMIAHTGTMHSVVFVINYESLWRAPIYKALSTYSYDLIIADECFSAGAKISTPSGHKPIEDLKVGNKVMGYHQGRVVTTEVKHTFCRKTTTPLLPWGDAYITPNHPVYDGHEYIPAKRSTRGLHYPSISMRPLWQDAAGWLGPSTTVFNIETGTGNYFSEDFLVHNCHRVRGVGSKQSRAIHRLGMHAKRKIGMSGTPLPKGPVDAYGIVRFLDDTIFGTRFDQFSHRYIVMGGFEGREILGYRNMAEFAAKLGHITHKIDPSVLVLPPVINQNIPTPLPNMAAYRRLQSKSILQLGDTTITADNKLTVLLRLQQFTSGSVGGVAVHTEKLDAAQELISETAEPFVIFCRFTSDVMTLREVCRSIGIEPMIQTGSQRDYERFKAGESRILIGQIQATCEGLDLTKCGEWQCRRAIFYSLGFSLYEYEQAKKRIHRPGQKETCYYYHLIAPETVDEKVMDAIAKKRQIVEWVASSLTEIKHGQTLVESDH